MLTSGGRRYGGVTPLLISQRFILFRPPLFLSPLCARCFTNTRQPLSLHTVGSLALTPRNLPYFLVLHPFL